MFIHRTVVSFPRGWGSFVYLLNAIELTSFCCECVAVRSMMQKLGLRHSKSFSVRSETANVHVKEKACGTSDGTVDIQ